jgi:Carboxypeptidase regulatory-like domain
MLFEPLVWMLLAQVPSTPLSGKVVGPGGEPVVGAELILVGLPSYDPRIVARGTSGEDGLFSLNRPAALAGDHHPQRAPILWVRKQGFRVSATRFPEALPKPDEQIRIVLEPPGMAEVRVEGPDGQPLGGVTVLPQRLKTHNTNVPDIVAGLASATTGPDGLAVLDAVSPKELSYVDVHSREFGIQGRWIVTKPDKPVTITLRPTSTWKGRLSAQDRRHVRGWHVRAWTRIIPYFDAEPQTTGYVETTTDDEGRFALAPIAVGGLELTLKPPGHLPVVADLPRSLAVRAGREDSVDIPLRSTVTVTGLFLERGTKKPVPGIAVMLFYIGGNRDGSQTVKTDERGRYTLQSLPGLVRVGHFQFPPTHVQAPGQEWEDFTVPEPPKLIELATREAIPAAPPLQGQVVDEAGSRVPGALIQASWTLTGKKGNRSSGINTEADAKGGFVLQGLGPGSTVSITARYRDRQSKSPLEVQADGTGPVTVAITPFPVLAVTGRVLGPGGTPLVGIPVTVQFRVPRDNFQGFAETARFDSTPEIKTAADGTFRTPKELERKPSEFRIEVTAEGFLPARTAWVPLPAGDLLTLPDLTLKRSKGIQIVSGRVVDREGHAVPGATVSQAGDGPRCTSARTDGDGRFRLRGVSAGAALIFAEAPGFRFGGTIKGSGTERVEIRLARVNEPPMAILKSLPPPISRLEERALARQIVEPLLPLARLGSLGSLNSEVIPALARVDAARVLYMIENRAIDYASGSLIQAALGQFEDDPAAAIATIEDDTEPSSRAHAWLALEAFRPAADRGRREDLLDRALADLRKSMRAEIKIRLLGQLADRWLALGSLNRARPILREGQAILAAWPKDKWLFEAENFAEVLAVIDLPAATVLFERRGWTNISKAQPLQIKRSNAQAAVRIAAIDPAATERLIVSSALNPEERPWLILQVARKMAGADLARARRLLETLDDSNSGTISGRTLVPFGLGAIADELAATNLIQARALLDESFAGLRNVAVDGRTGLGQESIANLMAELLPVVERIDPDRLAERIWLIAACRSPAHPVPQPHDLAGTFALAMLVARYDRAIAEVIAAADLEQLPDLLADSGVFYPSPVSTIVKSLTSYDPRAIGPLLQALPDAARRPPSRHDAWNAASIESQIRLAAVQILGFPSAARPVEAGRVGTYYLPYRLSD